MAARLKLSRDEALEEIMSAETERAEMELEEENVEKKIENALSNLVVGEVNKDFFLPTAVNVLVPLYELSRNETHPGAARILTSFPIYPCSVLKQESMLWLQAIHRRLSGRRGIRRPFYGEISRDIPYDLFRVVGMLVRNLEGFCEPFCFHSNNKKAEVISFTSVRLVKELMVLLSGLQEEEVVSSFKRSLGGARKGHKVSIIVSDVRDFAFIYKFKQGKLIIAFNFGEWNANGFPQHT